MQRYPRYKRIAFTPRLYNDDVIEVYLFAGTLLLAYANGANDNFKGVATLYGSGLLTYRTAKILSTIATLAGAMAAVLLAGQLAKAFSGRGLVPDHTVAEPLFAMAVGLSAGLTVWLATRIGMPISTTHALVGGLAGAGFIAAGAINISVLIQQFLAPLLLGPVLAFTLSAAVCKIALRKPRGGGSDGAICVCIDGFGSAPVTSAAAISMPIPAAQIRVASSIDPICRLSLASKNSLAITTPNALNLAHIVSGGMVCLARGLNDAPKIAGLLLIANATGATNSFAAVALAMAIGGWLHARRIADTMSHKIIALAPQTGFIANLCTATLVIAASKFGLPLSTTHISVGAISGISLSGSSHEKISSETIKNILLAWLFTLPVAALLAVCLYPLLKLLLR